MSIIGAELRFACIEGVLFSIEADCCYTRCVQCLKKQDGNSCNLCNTDTVLAFKCIMYLEMEGSCIRIVCFDDSISRWLNKSVRTLCDQLEKSAQTFLATFDKYIDKKIVVRIGYRMKQYEDKEFADIIGYSICM